MKLLLLLFCALLPLSISHHILLVHSIGTKSHLIVMKPVVEELLNRGHTVTSVIFHPFKLSHENHTEILVTSRLDRLFADATKKLLAKGGSNPMNPLNWLPFYQFLLENMKDLALDMFESEELRRMVKDRTKVDAVMTLYPGNAIFGEIFDCPIIIFSPVGPISMLTEGSTNIINHSVQPAAHSAPFIEPLSFKERLQNHFSIFRTTLFTNWQTDSMFVYHKEFLKEELGVDVKDPHLTLREKVALVLAASHPVTHGAWQYTRNIIEVGGLQLKDAKPLEGDLKKFMDSATEGAVLVSFGSSLKPDQMPQEKIQVFIDTFKQLGMKVIWKWDKEMPGLPDNILLSSWLPQQDLLAHPNLRVFVTHGGLGSLVEAIYHKAVIVGIPLSNDQKPNLLRAERHGYAVSLDWDEMTADELVESIKKAMGDKEMAANLERIHNLYLDREEKPVEKAAWWVEYVCRHGGADWLKSIGEDVPFYQYHHLDIILVLAIAALISLTGTFFFWRTVFRCLCGKKTKID